MKTYEELEKEIVRLRLSNNKTWQLLREEEQRHAELRTKYNALVSRYNKAVTSLNNAVALIRETVSFLH